MKCISLDSCCAIWECSMPWSYPFPAWFLFHGLCSVEQDGRGYSYSDPHCSDLVWAGSVEPLCSQPIEAAFSPYPSIIGFAGLLLYIMFQKQANAIWSCCMGLNITSSANGNFSPSCLILQPFPNNHLEAYIYIFD